MKSRCTVSHEEPQEGGGFKRFEAGQEYEGDFECPYFEPPVILAPLLSKEGNKRGGGVKDSKEVTGDDN